jgi:hypothetical protein
MNEREKTGAKRSRAVHTDLNEARKNERSIRRLKRILAVLIVIFVGLLIYVTYPFWLPKLEGIFDKPVSTIQNDGKTAEGNFPIEPSDPSATDIYAVKNNLMTVDSYNVTFYDENGKERSSYSHAFASPSAKVSGRRVLLFDSGSDGFKVYNKSGEIYSKTAENTILTGSIGEDGTVAIVTSSDKYPSAMQIYDSDGKLIYRYNCIQRIMSAYVTADGSGAYVCTFSSDNGEIYSQVHKISFDSEEEKWVSDSLKGIAVGCIKNSGGRISVVCDGDMYTLDTDGTVLTSYEYGGTLSGFSLTENCAAVLVSGSTGSSDTLVIADADKNDENAYCEITDLSDTQSVGIYDKRVVVTTSSKAISYAFDGTLAATATLEKNYTDFVYINSSLYLLSRQGIDKIGFDM